MNGDGDAAFLIGDSHCKIIPCEKEKEKSTLTRYRRPSALGPSTSANWY